MEIKCKVNTEKIVRPYIENHLSSSHISGVLVFKHIFNFCHQHYMLSSQLYGLNTNHVRSGVLADSKFEIDHMYV